MAMAFVLALGFAGGFGFFAVVAACRYLADMCSGPESLTSDCEYAFYTMIIGGGVAVVASAIALVCILTAVRMRASDT